VKHPSDVVKPDQELERHSFLKFDKESSASRWGLKQLIPDPWSALRKSIRQAARSRAKIVGVVDYGVFVELEQGIEGLVTFSEMSWNKKVTHHRKSPKSAMNRRGRAGYQAQ